MKKYFTLILIITLISSCNDKNKTIKNNNKELRHVVLFKFKKETSTINIKKIEDLFIGLKSKIDVIKDFEWGLNNSTEGLNKGFTHCFFVTFNSEGDREKYLPHPKHLAFVSVLKPHIEDVLVLDYWAK